MACLYGQTISAAIPNAKRAVLNFEGVSIKKACVINFFMAQAFLFIS
jgi:hypothetical protein